MPARRQPLAVSSNRQASWPGTSSLRHRILLASMTVKVATTDGGRQCRVAGDWALVDGARGRSPSLAGLTFNAAKASLLASIVRRHHAGVQALRRDELEVPRALEALKQ